MPFGPGVTLANRSRNPKRLREQRSGPACLLLKTILPVISRAGALDCGIFRLPAQDSGAYLPSIGWMRGVTGGCFLDDRRVHATTSVGEAGLRPGVQDVQAGARPVGYLWGLPGVSSVDGVRAAESNPDPVLQRFASSQTTPARTCAEIVPSLFMGCRSFLQSTPGVLQSMPEVANAGEDHGHTKSIGGGDYVLILY